MTAKTVRDEFVWDFGEAYLTYGLPKLMGNVVGLLLYHDKALSLDEITKELNVSKGPVSQVMSRLRDNGQVRRINVPGNRKDFYEADENIFGVAFAHHALLFRRNLSLAKKFKKKTKNSDEVFPESFKNRIDEMVRFNTLLAKHLDNFMEEWEEVR